MRRQGNKASLIIKLYYYSELATKNNIRNLKESPREEINKNIEKISSKLDDIVNNILGKLDDLNNHIKSVDEDVKNVQSTLTSLKTSIEKNMETCKEQYRTESYSLRRAS